MDVNDIPAELLELIDRPLCAQISTVSPKGAPQTSLVWFERRGTEIIMMSHKDAPKVRNLRQNPKMEAIVVDPGREVSAGSPVYARLTGTAEIRPYEDGIEDLLARRYGHPDGYPSDGEPMDDVVVTIHMTIRRVSGFGPYNYGESWVPDEANAQV